MPQNPENLQPETEKLKEKIKTDLNNYSTCTDSDNQTEIFEKLQQKLKKLKESS